MPYNLRKIRDRINKAIRSTIVSSISVFKSNNNIMLFIIKESFLDYIVLKLREIGYLIIYSRDLKRQSLG
jgi:hypothetical protein